MRRCLTLSLLLLAMALLSGCAASAGSAETAARPQYQNGLLRLVTRHSVHFADLRSARLSAEEALRLERFLESSLAGRGAAKVTLQELGPSGQAHAVREFLLQRGFLERDLHLAGRPPVVAPEPRLEVVVERFAAVPPACGHWSGSSEMGVEQSVLGNLGCANARALGLMVANPADLEGGALPEAAAEGAREALVTGRYLEGTLPPLPASEGFVEQ